MVTERWQKLKIWSGVPRPRYSQLAIEDALHVHAANYAPGEPIPASGEAFYAGLMASYATRSPARKVTSGSSSAGGDSGGGYGGDSGGGGGGCGGGGCGG